MNVRGILAFFEQCRRDAQALVLVTVYETHGSTYSKPGALMLLDAEGHFHGMLSGGCLEGDLALRAAEVVGNRSATLVTYDLSQDDELWGLGVGCEGVMRVMLQPLFAASGYEPFATIARVLQGRDPCRFGLVIEADSGLVEPGAAVVEEDDELHRVNMDADSAAQLVNGPPGVATVELAAGTATVLRAVLRPAPRLLVMGAGLDAEPVVRIAAEMGWGCTVVDHRESYVESGDFEAAEALRCFPADALGAEIDLSLYDAAIVMSHHLASDRSYLRQLGLTDIAYIGLLGPRARRDRLLAELGDERSNLDGRLHGPAGLDLGGRGPAPIALSIIAEIQSVLVTPGAG